MSDVSTIWAPTVDVVDAQLRADLASILSPEVGAGLVGYDDDIIYTGDNVGAKLNALTGQIDNLAEVITGGYASVEDFGAVGDGVTDDAPAFAAALASHDRIYMPNPAVAYLVNTPIAITRSNIKFLGESRFLTKVRAGNNSLPVFAVSPGLSGIELTTFKMDRSVPASATGSGVECSGSLTDSIFRELLIEDQWNGLSVGDGLSCQVLNCRISNNYGHGLRIQSGATPLLNWDVRDCQFGWNNGSGVSIEGLGSAPAADLGEFSNVYCVYNAEYGMKAVGTSAKKLNALRLDGGTFTSNGAGGLYLDTFGERHRFVGISANTSGTTPTGRQAAPITASSAGSGITVTANNQDMIITGCVASKNSYNGIKIAAALAVISGGSFINNGVNTAIASAERSGINLTAGKILVNANNCTNYVGGTPTQVQGIYADGGVDCLIEGNNCKGNINAAGITLVNPSNTNSILNNIGYNPKTTDTVAPGASPWVYTAGNTPEDLYIKGGTFTSLVVDGQTLATAASAATQYLPVMLLPNQQLTLTYSAAPTIIRKFR